MYRLLSLILIALYMPGQCLAMESLEDLEQGLPSLRISAVSDEKKIEWMLRQQLTVFAAEDSTISARLLSDLFKSTKSTLSIFKNGQALLAGLENTKLTGAVRPHFILLDGNMPVLNGWETIVILKETYKKDCPPIFAVAASNEEEKSRFMELGVTAFVEKPISKQILFPLVYDWFNRDSTPTE